ncbi:hypothetical protein GCM10027047_17140 [Rhodococcus aerolatus]
MAPPAAKIRPARYLAAFVAVVAVLYALVFLTGDRSPTPKLGIDLQGGTQVTLTARTPDGNPPTQQSLEQARTIIETRVNGLGVSGSEVVVDGSNLVITVPGDNSSQARNLGQTAQLYIRPVLQTVAASATGSTAGSTAPSTDPAAPSTAPAPASTSAPAPTSEPAPTSAGTAPQGFVAPAQAPTTEPTPTTEPAPTSTDPAAPTAAAPATPSSPTDSAAAIAAAKALRQSTDQATQAQALTGLACDQNDPLLGNDDPSLPLVTCSSTGDAKYLLGPAIITGTQISGASSGPAQGGVGFQVSLDFTSEGSATWADFTAANVGKQAAFVLDSQVVSAPRINQAITGGQTQITGSFSQQQAADLANTLKYGSLPLSFSQSEAQTVSASLGSASLQAGLIAGGIGLVLVLLYCLVYYRALGLLTALSLVLSGVIVYGVLVLLGRYIGFTLDLSGIAGFIVAIGITADSFVVFFERLKDEVREGRSFRSAVPRGWVRARHTILSADAVSFLAAAVLYVLAVGQVKGFAFTLGMSTVLDLVVVFLVTHPLVVLASRSDFWSRPSVTGLGAVQQIARNRKRAEAAQAGASRPGSSTLTKEA